jgi:hypothetical protein
MNPHRYRAKRRLYVEDYVFELARIKENYYPGYRLDCTSWASFQSESHEVYYSVVMPLLDGVIPPVEIEVLGTRAWDWTVEGMPSTTTSAQDSD